MQKNFVLKALITTYVFLWVFGAVFVIIEAADGFDGFLSLGSLGYVFIYPFYFFPYNVILGGIFLGFFAYQEKNKKKKK